MPKVINLKVDNYEELRDSLSTSGLFDILDCEVELECSPETTDEEIDKMFGIIRSTVNIVRTRVISFQDSEEFNFDEEEFYNYHFKISEVQYRDRQGRFQR